MNIVEKVRSIFDGKEFKLGIVLGGGGTRGFAHLGVLKALKELEIEPEICCGVSAGAIVGAYWAAETSADDCFELLTEQSVWSYSKMKWPKHGLLDLGGLEKRIQEDIPFQNIEDLPKPFFIGVSNLTQGSPEYINKGNLAKTVLASSSIPVVFQSVKMGDDIYVDGGLLDNLPVRPIKAVASKAIAVSISPIKPEKEVRNLLKIATRTFQLAIEANTRESRSRADILIEPDGLRNYEMLSTKNSKAIFDLGYNAVMEEADDLKAMFG